MRHILFALTIFTALGCSSAATEDETGSVAEALVITDDAVLQTTGIDPDATGTAHTKANTQTGVEDLSIKLDNLDPNAVYLLVIDGIEIRNFLTSADGGAILKLSNNPRGQVLAFPAGMSVLTMQLIEVRNLSGQVILSGSF